MQQPARYASGIIALLTATAAIGDGVPDALRRCAAIDEDAARLACYDAYVAGARAATATANEPPAASVPPDPATSAAERSADAEARFGLPTAPEEEPTEITAKITDIAERAYGERIFTLDNDQVWVEDSRARTLKLEVGDTVRISAGLFGSYRLRGSGNRSTGVDRIR
ncbi:MAG TPA: hypothetical protein VF200_02595 [Woeseiaceae bacterium]